MRTSTQCLLILGLYAWLFSTPSCVRADSADDLQAQYDGVQREMNANASQITSLQNRLDAAPNKWAGSDSHVGHSDIQSIKNTILDLKQKNNDLFSKGDEAATQLRKIGRDPDRPRPSHGSAGTDRKPTDLPVDASTSAASKPLEKQDIGDVTTADVNSFPPEIIPLKPVLAINPQNVPEAPIASNNSKVISPPIPPVQIDPAVEQAIDEKVRKQKPEVDALFAPSPAEPEPSVDLAAAPPAAPAEQSQVKPPETDWGSIVLGTIIVGGAIAGGVAASSAGGDGYSSGGGSGAGYSTGAGMRHPSGGSGYGGAIHCH
jgi:hypothetical protein